MREQYILIRMRSIHNQLVVIKRLTGGWVAGKETIKKFTIVYPRISTFSTRELLYIKMELIGNGRNTGGSLYNKERFHYDKKWIIDDIFKI